MREENIRIPLKFHCAPGTLPGKNFFPDGVPVRHLRAHFGRSIDDFFPERRKIAAADEVTTSACTESSNGVAPPRSAHKYVAGKGSDPEDDLAAYR
jgi:hypothetical protein